MKFCTHCRHFADGQYSKTYISPRCKARGDDDCMYMRAHVCTMDAKLYEPKQPTTTDQPG